MEVFVVPSDHRGNPFTADIIKVGRKWATLDSNAVRFDIKTWRIDGGAYSSPGTCYPNEQEYNDQQELKKMWASFKQEIYYASMPHELTIEAIKKAAMLLGVDL
jgi:hypothetical protein